MNTFGRQTEIYQVYRHTLFEMKKPSTKYITYRTNPPCDNAKKNTLLCNEQGQAKWNGLMQH